MTKRRQKLIRGCETIKNKLLMYSGATLRVDAGGSLYSPQLWQIPEHQKIPEYSWDPYQETDKEGTKSKL